MNKALLVYPKTPPSFWSFNYAIQFQGKKSAFPPLGALTIASFFPKDEWDLKLKDLNVEKLTNRDIKQTDVVCISAMNIHLKGVEKIIKRAKAHGKKTILGGPIVSTHDPITLQADHLIEGEAETIIESFLQDLKSGKAKAHYKAKEKPPLTLVRLPRYDLIKLKKYSSMAVQFSRGCPFNCDFCDITKIYGRFPRVKEEDKFIAELDHLLNNKWKGPVFIVDDNFIGNLPAIKKLLPKIEAWQKANKYPFSLFTEASVNLAKHPDVLQAMVNAGFNKVFLGIETPVKESLMESRKVQNTVQDLNHAVESIQRAGVGVMAGFIIGFDNDPENIFSIQESFIQSSAIPVAMLGLFSAIPGTDLYIRLKQEGRIVEQVTGNNTDGTLNFIPKMNREKLIQGYRDLMKRIYTPKAYFHRAYASLERMRKAPKKTRTRITLSDLRALLQSFMVQGFWRKGRFQYWKYLTKTILFHRKRLEEAMTLAIMNYHFQKINALYLTKS